MDRHLLLQSSLNRSVKERSQESLYEEDHAHFRKEGLSYGRRSKPFKTYQPLGHGMAIYLKFR